MPIRLRIILNVSIIAMWIISLTSTSLFADEKEKTNKRFPESARDG